MAKTTNKTTVEKSSGNVSGGLRSRIVGHGRERAVDILANPFNHRLHPEEQRQVVSASLEEIGWVKSIIVNRTTGHIVDGHERVMNALGRGDDTLVDVEYVELSPEEEKKALLVLDASSEMAKVDADALSALAADCSFDSDVLSGLAEQMLADLGSGHRILSGDDDVPEPPLVAKSKPGDLWILGDHRVLCGDSTNPDDVSRLLMGSSPDLMVTDPPYGVEYDPEWRKNKLHGYKAGLDVTNDHRADWREAYDLFPGSVAYVWHSALYAGEFFNSLVGSGFEIRAQIVWVKENSIITRGHYRWQHESAFVAERPQDETVSDQAEVSETGNVATEDDEREADFALYAVRKGRTAKWCGGRKRTTVWDIGFKTDSKTIHGTQKPVECMARPMQNHGKPGDVVYDPFLGSGSSIIAAERTCRACRGMEIDPIYVDVIVARWEAFTGKKAVLASAE